VTGRCGARCGARCSGWASTGSGPSSSWADPIRPTPSKNALAEPAAAVVATGGPVGCGAEPPVREVPPRRACWARRGQQRAQRAVVLSGRTAWRVIQGALNSANGEFGALLRERRRQDDCLALVAALGRVHPEAPKLRVWETAPPHHPRRVAAAAATAPVTRACHPRLSPAPGSPFAPLSLPRTQAVRGSLAPGQSAGRRHSPRPSGAIAWRARSAARAR
jgi:hypothetical protein